MMYPLKYFFVLTMSAAANIHLTVLIIISYIKSAEILYLFDERDSARRRSNWRLLFVGRALSPKFMKLTYVCLSYTLFAK